ncbi:MAG: substrate-binding domain-containing protein, partial [Anaerolineae bacterium]|nr:substrate-binding domain-containing protein [Anaerolineae bacterium]
KMATEYLIQRGHRRIGIIGCNLNWAGEYRYEGYCSALRENDIRYNPDLVTFGDFSMDSAYEAMKKLLDADADAVFVVSDTMALGALRCIREHGLKVPDDVAVIGYDDLPVALHADPPLTTIRQPIEEQTKRAVEILTHVIELPDSPRQEVVLPTKLIIRGTTR